MAKSKTKTPAAGKLAGKTVALIGKFGHRDARREIHAKQIARAGGKVVDPATVAHWIDLSLGHQPAIDREVMSATFLRYQGAEAGEVDWRPTETVPEDYYAL